MVRIPISNLRLCELLFKIATSRGLRSRSSGSAQISQLIGVVSALSVRFMGDKSPKSKNKQAAQKQAKAAVESQKKRDAVSSKQVEKPKK